MSRALERLRSHLGDDLLIRSGGQSQLTPRAVELIQELTTLIPRLERVWSGSSFSPSSAVGDVRVMMTDYAAALLLADVSLSLQRHAPHMNLVVNSWHSRSYEDLSTGKVDLVLSPLAPSVSLISETLFEEEFTCVVSEKHPFRGRSFSLETYLKQRHISVETEPGQQTLVDRRLAETGFRRSVCVQLPFFLPSVLAINGTDLVLTAPSLLGRDLLKQFPIRAIKAPRELAGFSYLMVWHPRLKDEPLHTWFRNLVVTCAKDATARAASPAHLRRSLPR